MKKGTVLNADISAVISRLGHTDTLVSMRCRITGSPQQHAH